MSPMTDRRQDSCVDVQPAVSLANRRGVSSVSGDKPHESDGFRIRPTEVERVTSGCYRRQRVGLAASNGSL